jgi:hypothetical protein
MPVKLIKTNFKKLEFPEEDYIILGFDDTGKLVKLDETGIYGPVIVETSNTELDISNIEDTKKNDYGGHYPDEVKGAAEEVYEEGIPEEYKEVIKEYFKKINE